MIDIRALLALLFTMIAWGVGPVFFRSLSLELGPGDHLVIRYTLVSLLYLVGLVIFGGWRFETKDLPRLATISFIGMLGYNLGSAFGFELINAGTGSLIIGTQPLLIALLGAMLERERLTPAAIIGLAVGLVGTIFLVWKDLGVSGEPVDYLTGCFFIFASGACWALYAVTSKPLIRKYGAFPITALSIIAASLAMLALFGRPSTLGTLQAMSPRSWMEMAYLVVMVTFAATITWNFGAGRLPAAAAGAFLYMVPPIGVMAGAVILGEAVTPGMLIGGVLIMGGVAISQFGHRLNTGAGLAALGAILFAVTMWGLIPVAMRYLILDLSPQTAMVLRLFPAGLLAIIVLLFVGVRRIEWRDWGRIAIAALAGNLGYQILAAFGMQTVPASWTGLIFGLEPVWIALFAVLLAAEKLTPWLIAGIFVAMLGTAALMLGSTLAPTGGVTLFGVALVTLSTLGWGIYTVVIRPVSRKYGALQVACLTMAIAALPMPLFVGLDFPQTLAGMGTVSWLAVGFVVVFGTFLATSAWTYALGHMESSTAGMFLYVQPIVAAIGGVVLLDEELTWPLLAGGALIIFGVAIAQFGPLVHRPPLAPSRNALIGTG